MLWRLERVLKIFKDLDKPEISLYWKKKKKKKKNHQSETKGIAESQINVSLTSQQECQET